MISTTISQPRKLDTLIEQIIGFVRVYGTQAHLGDDDYLRREILWHSTHDRIDLLWSDNRLAGVFLWMILDTLQELKHNQFPRDNPRGEYFYVALAVIHPLYRSAKLLARLLQQKQQEFSNLNFLYYYDADNHYQPKLIRLSPTKEE